MNSKINKGPTDIWLLSLGFYSQELDVLKHRLMEISGKDIVPEGLIVAPQDESKLVVKPDNICLSGNIVSKDVTAWPILQSNYLNYGLHKATQVY